MSPFLFFLLPSYCVLAPSEVHRWDVPDVDASTHCHQLPDATPLCPAAASSKTAIPSNSPTSINIPRDIFLGHRTTRTRTIFDFELQTIKHAPDLHLAQRRTARTCQT
ncbi:hypothetical protein B0H13DRAFT_2381907 [Mycena leptocephala]|nr:hypothetical protein B0H13DRAFT_2381907 [Mycena leptocephala]